MGTAAYQVDMLVFYFWRAGVGPHHKPEVIEAIVVEVTRHHVRIRYRHPQTGVEIESTVSTSMLTPQPAPF